MSNIQTGAERMPHDLSHLGFLAGQIGRLITISTTPVIAGDSFEMDAVGALRLSPLRRGLAIDSTHTWPYGYSMPIAVRYTQDAFSRSGWLWPVDAKGEPLKATSYMAVGFYVAKYVNKKSD